MQTQTGMCVYLGMCVTHTSLTVIQRQQLLDTPPVVVAHQAGQEQLAGRRRAELSQLLAAIQDEGQGHSTLSTSNTKKHRKTLLCVIQDLFLLCEILFAYLATNSTQAKVSVHLSKDAATTAERAKTVVAIVTLDVDVMCGEENIEENKMMQSAVVFSP
jgi:hypothetical protein